MCASSYQFNQTSLACNLNCSLVTNSLLYNTKVNTTNATNCTCRTSAYLWNATTAACSLNCSLVQNSTGSINNTDGCLCPARFYYNATFTQCLINCTLVPNSLGSNNVASSKCNCISTSDWNPINLTCDLNCTRAFSNYPGQYFWNFSISNCQRNCSIPYSTGKNTNTSACECVTGFTWNSTL